MADTEDATPGIELKFQAKDNGGQSASNGPQGSTGTAKKRGRHSKSTGKSRKGITEWVSTTQGFFAIIATLVTLVFGGGGLVAVKEALWSSRPGLTGSQVEAALLAPSDLSAIAPSLTYLNINTANPPACNKANAELPQAAIEKTRELFSANQGWEIWEDVAVYSSTSSAHADLAGTPQIMSCDFTEDKSLFANVSSSFNQVCDENESWAVGASSSFQLGWATIRCGKIILQIEVAPTGASPESGTALNQVFLTASEVAAEKVESLPGS